MLRTCCSLKCRLWDAFSMVSVSQICLQLNQVWYLVRFVGFRKNRFEILVHEICDELVNRMNVTFDSSRIKYVLTFFFDWQPIVSTLHFDSLKHNVEELCCFLNALKRNLCVKSERFDRVHLLDSKHFISTFDLKFHIYHQSFLNQILLPA
uniref:Uncharacterized protein n=1 Tax=Myoviridae sp. ctbEa13 TaxID=2825136 RepID=A0A8S5VBU4_9CAUD|nr:MAG TPA: hypothetical protein [Myoviridae sp. ctbEa13]